MINDYRDNIELFDDSDAQQRAPSAHAPLSTPPFMHSHGPGRGLIL